MAESIPILPRSGLYLFAVDGKGKRFASIFANTWRKLPLGVRRRLLKHWRAVKVPAGRPWPHIELIAGKSDFRRGNSGNARGQTGALGHTFAFKSTKIDKMAPHEVEWAIAHELAHAYLYAVEPEKHIAGMGTPETYDNAPSELAANALAFRWVGIARLFGPKGR